MFGQSRDQALRCDNSVGVLADGCEFVPVDLPVQADTDPSPPANVGRPEETSRLGRHEFLLRAEGRRAPQMRELMIMVTVTPQHHELLAHEEAR